MVPWRSTFRKALKILEVTLTGVPVAPSSLRALPPEPLLTKRVTSRQQEILDGLEAIVLTEGFAQLTIGDLANRLRCSRRTFYTLAEDKDQLVLVVLDRMLWRIGRDANARIKNVLEPRERVRVFIGAAINQIGAVTLRFAEDLEQTQAARRLFQTHYEYATKVLGGIIQDGIDQHKFTPYNSILVAHVFDAALARLQQPRVLLESGLSEAEGFHTLTELVLNGLAIR